MLVNDATGTRIVANILASNADNGIDLSGTGTTNTLIQANAIGGGIGGQALGNSQFGLVIINGAGEPTQVGNINVNNTLGPIRDTNVAPVSATSLNISASSVTETVKAKGLVKVQAKAPSFRSRSLQSLQTRGKTKSKSRT